MSKAIPASVTRLIEAFAQLPGVGNKTASRLTYFLLRAPAQLSENLAQAIAELKTKTRLCSICFNITEEEPCAVCADPQRDASIVMVVEEPLDVLAIERTGSFNGRYHVLHGVISPRDGIGPEQLKIRELIKRVQEGSIAELILGTNPGLEGDATAMYIKSELEAARLQVRLTRLARGLPSGADLEYADSVTLTRALQGRQAL
ncbi:MAG: recombination protein RecR [Chloroflexota bacterium]|jgi:recombination protein RecR|nr:MAG: recombination protein RecR [Chloroflexota bacterium]